MPYFPTKGEGLPSEEYAYKQVFRHQDSEDHLVLERKQKNLSWLEQISDQDNWTEEEKRAFLFSQFYLKKLLHSLFPDSFAEFTYVDQLSFVTKEVKGEAVNWTSLTAEEQAVIQNSLDQLGIKNSNLDLSGYNFIREKINTTPTGKVTYVDDVLEESNFFYLAKQKNDPSPLTPQLAALPVKTEFYKNIVDEQKLTDFLNNPENGLSDQQKRRAETYWSRFQKYASVFPGRELLDFSAL